MKVTNDTNFNQRYASVNLKDHDDHLEIDFLVSDNEQDSGGEIRISGLSKYLQRIDVVIVRCSLREPSDIFYVWWVIQTAMIDRSRFFSLIDIYGHYANRGDTVKVEGSYGFSHFLPMSRALDFFLNSVNCGGFWDKKEFAAIVKVTQDKIPEVVRRMREVRMDMRSENSHPILGADRLICTYPFPLLSQKALVVSKVEFLDKTA